VVSVIFERLGAERTVTFNTLCINEKALKGNKKDDKNKTEENKGNQDTSSNNRNNS